MTTAELSMSFMRPVVPRQDAAVSGSGQLIHRGRTMGISVLVPDVNRSVADFTPVVEVDHPKRGKYLTVGNPIKLSDSPTDVTRSPLLGEHTDEVLKELGYGAADIASLRANNVI